MKKILSLVALLFVCTIFLPTYICEAKDVWEILTLAMRAENESTSDTQEIAGNIYIGSAEAVSVRFITRTAYKLQQ